MSEHVTLVRPLLSEMKLGPSSFQPTSVPLASPQIAPPTSDSRTGTDGWSLYGNSGSQQIQSAGVFDVRTTRFYGTEGTSGPNQIGVSRYEFTEQVQYLPMSMSFPKETTKDGKPHEAAGQIPVMLNAISIWSGKMRDSHSNDHDTPASAQYYVTQVIRRQRVAHLNFHLYIIQTQCAYQNVPVAGTHKIRVYNDSTNVPLQELDVPYPPDPHTFGQMISYLSDLVNVGDILRVELIAQLALSNPNSNAHPVCGGAFSGAGFLDEAP